MAQPDEDGILEALKAVVDPDRGADIVSLGMVSGVVVRQGNVGFSIEVDPARGAEMEPVRKAAETAVAELAGVLSVTAVLTAHDPEPTAAAPQPATTRWTSTASTRCSSLSGAVSMRRRPSTSSCIRARWASSKCTGSCCARAAAMWSRASPT